VPKQQAASLVNVMTVIRNPESTTLRKVIESEIKGANPPSLLGAFDDKRLIATVETDAGTNIKQLLDLPMSILLKQQEVGVQDGVIHVTVDTTPAPTTMKPPTPRNASSSKGHTTTLINNKIRTNPFVNSNRQNFPPLEEFFHCNSSNSSSVLSGGPATSSSTNSSSSRASRLSLSSQTSTSICQDFSLDMSIAGRAALTQHRYQIEKYGIDHDGKELNTSVNDYSFSPLSKEKDWDQLMDPYSTSPNNKSLVLTDINNTLYESEDSQILSSSNLTEVSDSYFDRSVIEALKTPVKMNRLGKSVTLSRGINNELDYSDDENSILLDEEGSSPIASTHVTNSSGLNGIFRAAMRMHNDLDKSSVSKAADESASSVFTNVSSISRKGGKQLSVSFAVDDSFAIEKIFSSQKKLQRNSTSYDDREMDEFGDFLLSPIGKENRDITFCVDSSFIVAHQSSPSCSGNVETFISTETPSSSPSKSGEMVSTPLQSGGEATTTATILSTTLLGPTTPSPEHKRSEAITRSKSVDECFRRRLLFDSPEDKGSKSFTGKFTSSSLITRSWSSSSSCLYEHKDELLSRNETHTTVPLEESSFSSSQREIQSLPPHHSGRVFGTDATSRLNSSTTVKTDASKNSSNPAKGEGTRFVGVSELLVLSFEMLEKACSTGNVEMTD
jgi:hypothetical protein